MSSLTPIQESDVDLLLQIFRRYKGQHVSRERLMSEALEREPRMTGSRLKAAVEFMVAEGFISKVGPEQWSLILPAMSKRAMASLSPLLENGVSDVAASSRKSAHSTPTNLRGTNGRVFDALSRRASDGATTAELQSEVRLKNKTQLSATLTGLHRAGWLDRTLERSHPREFRYFARSQRATVDRRGSGSGERADGRAQTKGRASTDRLGGTVNRGRAVGRSNQLDAEFALIRAVTDAMEQARGAGLAPGEVARAIEYALRRVTGAASN